MGPSSLLTLVILALAGPVLSINVYGVTPTCGPALSYSIITVNGTGFDSQNFTLRMGAAILDQSFTLAVGNASMSFLTPKNLNPGNYAVQVCSSGPMAFCSTVCSNCTTPINNCTTPGCTTATITNSTICCQVQCINATTPCMQVGQYIAYDVPPILLSITPATVTHKSNVSLFGQHFLDCGQATVRIQSSNAVQYIPAWLNASNEMVFSVSHGVPSGVVTLSLDGQHFDSISASPITLTNSPDYSDSDSMSADPGGSPNYVWLYILLGVVTVAAGAFLVYVIYRYRTKDDYSRMYDL